jgi:hypothetical protein
MSINKLMQVRNTSACLGKGHILYDMGNLDLVEKSKLSRRYRCGMNPSACPEWYTVKSDESIIFYSERMFCPADWLQS